MTMTSDDIVAYRTMSTRQKKAFWRANPVHGDTTIAIPGLSPFLMHSDNDDTVVKELFWTGFRGWERTSLRIWSQIAGSAPAGLVLDIGAYSGIYALIAGLANASHKVVAVDIQPRCLARVEQNCGLNGLANITTLHAACIDTEGSVPYFYYEESDVLSSIASVEPNAQNDLAAEAPGLPVDALVAREAGSMPVVLIKIDVEGAEDRTLLGAHDTLARHRPDVLIEINDHRKIGAISKLFPPGYHGYSIDETRPRTRRIGRFAKPFDSRNFLFSTRSVDEVQALADWSGVDEPAMAAPSR